jgi:hypothetical protein
VIPWYWKAGAALGMVVAVGAYGYIQGRDNVQQKWDKQNAEVAAALVVAFKKSADETEAIRGVFIEYKKGAEAVTAGLERDVAIGVRKLRVKANCVSRATDASGTAAGTAELDAAARLDYYALRRGIDEQRGLLNLCRAELKKRSNP